jgi:hypothetical protein
MPRKIVADVPQGSSLAPALYIPLKNDESRHLDLFAGDAGIYATEKQEHRVLCKPLY